MTLTVTVLPGAAQTQECMQLSRQLLNQLDDAPERWSDPEVEEQRRILHRQGCDPQLTGYDVEVEGRKLNQALEFKPEKSQPFRLDELIRIDY